MQPATDPTGARTGDDGQEGYSFGRRPGVSKGIGHDCGTQWATAAKLGKLDWLS